MYNISNEIISKEVYNYSTTNSSQLLSINKINTNNEIIETKTITYLEEDPFRPATYKNNNLTWNGKRLTSYGINTYKYNSEGIRISKTTSEGDYKYLLDGNKIIKEIKPNNKEIYYHYDEKEELVGFNYNTKEYFYIRDITGNITNIIDSNGSIKVSYEYDAWGKVINIDGDEDLIEINSYLYKGYYYDKETGLFWLSSRYYSPELCRFISPDSIEYLNPESINGLNLYAYCGNNPVMGYDPYGTFDLWEFFRGVGNIVTGALAIGAGAIVLIGGAPIGMLIVAGITVGAGVLTLNNGIADTVGSFTGYNYMSDGLFNGNTAAYNWYSGITSTVAGIGTAICGNFIKTEYFMRGATPGTEGKMTLQPGMELDRYGSKYGRFLTNPGTAPGQLNLPASNNLVLNHYKVLKPFKVATGIVDGGGGFQYFTWRSVHRLIQMRYLAII